MYNSAVSTLRLRGSDMASPPAESDRELRAPIHDPANSTRLIPAASLTRGHAKHCPGRANHIQISRVDIINPGRGAKVKYPANRVIEEVTCRLPDCYGGPQLPGSPPF